MLGCIKIIQKINSHFTKNIEVLKVVSNLELLTFLKDSNFYHSFFFIHRNLNRKVLLQCKRSGILLYSF